MTRGITRATGLIIGAAALALVALLSNWRYSAATDDQAVLRLAFSARPERLEHCREVSAAELAARPVHMRQRIECEGRAASYRLRVQLDSQSIADQVLRGGGMRHDRPLSLLVEHLVPPGMHHLDVRLERVEGADTTTVALTDSTRRARQPPLPASLSLTASPTFMARRVILLTYDIEQRRLVLRTQSAMGRNSPQQPADTLR